MLNKEITIQKDSLKRLTDAYRKLDKAPRGEWNDLMFSMFRLASVGINWTEYTDCEYACMVQKWGVERIKKFKDELINLGYRVEIKEYEDKTVAKVFWD